MQKQSDQQVILGGAITPEEFISVARKGAKVSFSGEYRKRVTASRALVERWVEEGRVIYGVTTGFGALCDKAISKEDTAALQRNILLTHSTSVGEPLTEEQVRGVMLMVLLNAGKGYSGIRLEVLQRYADFLNLGIIPFAPGDGSVGYLCPEAHIALTLIGEGKARTGSEWQPSSDILRKAGLVPLVLSSKEGLALISGTTGATALATLALADMITAAKSADIISALTFEILGGTLRAFDDRLMSVRPHKHQRDVACNLRSILSDSSRSQANLDARLQDALSLRCIPQLHGAARKTLWDAMETVTTEMNSCCDNPIIWPEGADGLAMSGCNADASFVGIEMDSAAIAASSLAKMSERRNNRLLDSTVSGLPPFLAEGAGLHSGLMIPQYTAAGLLNEIKILSHPATSDSIPTCAGQEDYVSMGYNACKKAVKVSENLCSILAIELLFVYAAHGFVSDFTSLSSVSQAVNAEIAKTMPPLHGDTYLYPYIEYLRNYIRSGELIKTAESVMGSLL